MKETTPPEAANSTSNPSRSSSWGRRLLFAAIVLVLMASSSYATYAWQQRKLTKLDSSLAASKDKIDFLSEQQGALEKELATLSTQNSELAQHVPDKAEVEQIITKSPETPTEKPMPQAPTFKVLGHRRHHDPKNRAVIVDMEITNPSKENQTLVMRDFVLKGEQSTSANFAEYAGQTMPNGYTVLSSRVIAPGETITGAMVFSSLGEPTGMYVLTYKDQSFTFFL